MTQNRFVCEKCGEIFNTRVETRNETLPVRGDKIDIVANVRVCEKCGTDIFDKVLDNENLLRAYDIYRHKHHIISPEEIRALRNTYDISQLNLALLLGWGEISITRYENGSLPDDAHNSMLKLIQDPFNMLRILEENGNNLPLPTREKLQKRLETILSEHRLEKAVEILSFPNRHRKPDIFTGYIEFKPEILMEMILFFASKPEGVLKTKVNKYLWYSDFIHFSYTTISISGAVYVHLPYGPVPDQYEMYLHALNVEGSLQRQEYAFNEEITGEKLIALRPPVMKLFSPTAQQTLEKVYQQLKKYSSKQISDLSHEEIGYIKTKQGEPISYEYADELKVQIVLDEMDQN